jgi:hypothetical protein
VNGRTENVIPVPESFTDHAAAVLDLPAAQRTEEEEAGARLLFGDAEQPPLALWLSMEPEEVSALARALVAHLRSPLFPARMAEGLTGPGDDQGLLGFARRFSPIAQRFAHGPELVLAALRIVAERGGPMCRAAALATIEQLLLRLHGEARSLAEPRGGERLRRFVLATRLAADLWVRFVPGHEMGSELSSRLAMIAPPPPPPAPPPAEMAAAEAMAEEAPRLAVPEPVVPQLRVLQPFTPPNDRPEWDSYLTIASPVPMSPVRRDAARRLAQLAEEAPAFEAPIREVRRALALAAHAGRPSIRMRPLLLVGPPGVGKTWFARRLANALGLPFSALNLGGATDNRCLQGTARGWSGATPAWPVGEMARLTCPNPVFFLDEVEKAGGARDSNGRAHDSLLAMVEPESAGAWFDECLRTEADLRHCVWILAANETRGISAPLLSRLSVHRIEPPPASAFDTTLRGLIGGIAADYGCAPADLPELDPRAKAALRSSFAKHRNLRRLRASLEECLGMAAEAEMAAAH